VGVTRFRILRCLAPGAFSVFSFGSRLTPGGIGIAYRQVRGQHPGGAQPFEQDAADVPRADDGQTFVV
jgi:hypothetical protein